MNARRGDVSFTWLPPRAELGVFYAQALELFGAAHSGDEHAIERVEAVSLNVSFESAQESVAREYGFATWARFALEVERRALLDGVDVAGLRALLVDHPKLAVEPLQHWCDHPGGASPLGYVAMLRYDTVDGRWRHVPGTGALAQVLLDAGAPVDGVADDDETPLMTAASYGDAEVALVLIEAGADLAATASPRSGGVPGGNALRHAVVFEKVAVLQMLLAAGATDLVHVAASGDLGDSLAGDTPEADRVAALRMAAGRGHLHVIDQLLAATTPVDGRYGDGSTALHEAAYRGRADAVGHLLACGADPMAIDARFDATPLGWCRHAAKETGPGNGHDAVEAILGPLAPDP